MPVIYGRDLDYSWYTTKVVLPAVHLNSTPNTAIEKRMQDLGLSEEDLQNETDYNSYKDPIHYGLIVDPVVDALGYTADRKSYQSWFSQGHHTQLTTNETLPNRHLIPNLEMRGRILTFIEDVASKKKNACSIKPTLRS